MKAEKATIGDVPRIHVLVNHFAEKGEMLPRALSEIYESLRDYFVVREKGGVVACASLHIYWSDMAEARAVAVAEEYQERGYGTLLVNSCMEEARGLGIPTVFCLTYRPGFFERFGFRRLDKMELPRKIWSDCYRCPKFPNCDEIALTCEVLEQAEN